MTKPTEFIPEASPRRDTTRVGGTVVGPGPGSDGEVPVGNGDGTATWQTLLASMIPISDQGVSHWPMLALSSAKSGGYFNATDVEGALAELAAAIASIGSSTTRYWPMLALSSGPPVTSAAAAIEFVIDGGGAVITTGIKGYLEIPFACTIKAVRMLADVSGSIVVDIWKDTYANYPPADGDSITASAVPTISGATKSQDTTLTGWTIAIAAGDILGFSVDSAATVTRVTVSLTVTKG